MVENNVMISDDQKIAEIFNHSFSNAVKNLNIDSYEHFSFDEYLFCKEIENKDVVLRAIEKYENHPSITKIRQHTPMDACFSFEQTDLKSVTNEVKNLNESKSTPMESIPAKMLKDISDILCPKIVIDFNSSIKTGIFPQNLKLADITPFSKRT